MKTNCSACGMPIIVVSTPDDDDQTTFYCSHCMWLYEEQFRLDFQTDDRIMEDYKLNKHT